MIAFGIATMSAFTVRVHGCIGGAVAGAALVAGAVVVAGATVVGGAPFPAGELSDFTDSLSALGDSVAVFVFSSLAAAAIFAAGFEGTAVICATGLSAAAIVVCAFATAAVSKLKAITVNEVTMRTGELEPNIFISPYYVYGRNINRLRQRHSGVSRKEGSF
jgi:hypothetical protein